MYSLTELIKEDSSGSKSK